MLVLLSPALQVQSVVWTGNLRPLNCEAVQRASLGRPLFLLPEGRLRALLDLDPARWDVDFARRLPGRLEVRLRPHRAAFVTANGTVLDRRGRVLHASHAVRGLSRIQGFSLAEDGRRLEPEDARLLGRLHDGLARSGLVVDCLERHGDDLVLGLARPTTRLLVSAADLEASLLKLELLRPALDAAAFPARVDLRYRDQIVLEPRSSEARRGRS